MAAAGPPPASVPASNSRTPRVVTTAYAPRKPSYITLPDSSTMFLPSNTQCRMALQHRRRKVLTVCSFVKDYDEKINGGASTGPDDGAAGSGNAIIATVVIGATSIAIMFTVYYYRFAWQMEGGDVSVTEILCAVAMSVGAGVGMEFWSRWIHKSLWHASWLCIHGTHHRPREGPFELNDLFAFLNAIPAVALISYGFYNQGLVPSLCFGAGTGITLVGIAYVLVHDGLVHERFPVGPLAYVPYFRQVAAAHLRVFFKGVPYGFFLGPKELEQVVGLAEKDKTSRFT